MRAASVSATCSPAGWLGDAGQMPSAEGEGANILSLPYPLANRPLGLPAAPGRPRTSISTPSAGGTLSCPFFGLATDQAVTRLLDGIASRRGRFDDVKSLFRRIRRPGGGAAGTSGGLDTGHAEFPGLRSLSELAVWRRRAERGVPPDHPCAGSGAARHGGLPDAGALVGSACPQAAGPVASHTCGESSICPSASPGRWCCHACSSPSCVARSWTTTTPRVARRRGSCGT